jgi:hypothetical protein
MVFIGIAYQKGGENLVYSSLYLQEWITLLLKAALKKLIFWGRTGSRLFFRFIIPIRIFGFYPFETQPIEL